MRPWTAVYLPDVAPDELVALFRNSQDAAIWADNALRSQGRRVALRQVPAPTWAEKEQ